jgi:hypothetical protein
MGMKEGNGSSRPKIADPAEVVAVRDFSPETLRDIVEHLEVSTEFEHMVYREAELDAIWTITGFFLASKPATHLRETVMRLHAGAHDAHDLVADGRAGEAATLLRRFL